MGRVGETIFRKNNFTVPFTLGPLGDWLERKRTVGEANFLKKVPELGEISRAWLEESWEDVEDLEMSRWLAELIRSCLKCQYVNFPPNPEERI